MNPSLRINFLVNQLDLEKHPEGGYYKEVYRASEEIPQNSLPERYSGPRSFSTSIYYLIMGKYPSRFHRIKSDEIWHFYEGSPVDVHIISPEGKHEVIVMGDLNAEPPVFQYTIFHGSWFGGIVKDQDSYCLLGCTVSPGFDFSDFEMAKRVPMTEKFPDHKSIIEKLTEL